MNESPPDSRTTDRNGGIPELRTRALGWLAVWVSLGLLATVAALGLGLALTDAALDLPEGVRAATGWLMGAAVVVGLILARLPARRLTEERVASLFESENASLGTKLTNAVQLSRDPGASAVEQVLRREAVRLGERAATGLTAWPVFQRRIMAAAWLGGVVGVAWLGVIWGEREVLQAVWPRFTDPRGDHPPFSRLRLSVEPQEGQVLYGGRLDVRATASGQPTEKLWLVGEVGTNITRVMMFLAPDKSFFQTLSNLRDQGVYFVTDGHARSHRYPIHVRYTPQITLVEVTTVFPDYTGQPSKTAKLAEDAQTLPADTRVTFRVASNRPLKGGTLTLAPVLGGKPTEIALVPEPAATNRLGNGSRQEGGRPAGPVAENQKGNQAQGSGGSIDNHRVIGGFTLVEPVAFTISVEDVDGLKSAESRRGRFNLKPDQRPRLLVLEPGRDAVATPTIRVPVRVRAEDDYGIARVAWLRGLNRSTERALAMKLNLEPDARTVQAIGSFNLDKLGVRPGDVIEYYFEAADNYPKGPNIALSRIYRLEVISEEQYKAILRQAAAQKALFEPYFRRGAWLRRLAEHARALQRKAQQDNPADRAGTRQEALAMGEDVENYLRELAQLIHEATMFDVEQSFRETLARQHTAMEQVAKAMREATAGGRLDARAMAEASAALDLVSRAEDEEISDPATRIAAVASLLARANDFVKLASEQATLAQLLRRFSERANNLSRLEQMEIQAIAERQEQVKKGLAALLASLPELTAKLTDEEKFVPLRNEVNAFLKSVADAQIEQTLDETARFLAEPDPSQAFKWALATANEMDKLISKCSSDLLGPAKECLHFQPSVQKSMGNTLEQILAAMGSQNGGDGENGFTWFNHDIGVYGPDMELAGPQGGGGREIERSGGAGVVRVTGGTAESPPVPTTNSPARVKLQPDAKFPLRYRDLVGEYFRAIAESDQPEGSKR